MPGFLQKVVVTLIAFVVRIPNWNPHDKKFGLEKHGCCCCCFGVTSQKEGVCGTPYAPQGEGSSETNMIDTFCSQIPEGPHEQSGSELPHPYC